MSEPPLIHLIDGHVYIFRAYYSLPEREAPDGTPVGAAYGFANTLLKYLRENEPTHVAVCFDHDLTSFRNDVEPDYKADRGVAPDDLEPQFDVCVQVARALGVPAFEMETYEADDVIATLATRALERGASVRIVTSDKDLAQLVTEDGRAVLYDLARERTLDAGGVHEKFGVTPGQIPDYLGLVGDAVDNLPGVPGVGPKSASAILTAFGTIDCIPSGADQWQGLALRGAARLAARVAEHRDRALRTRELATVVRDVPGLPADPAKLAWRGAPRDDVTSLFERLGWEGITTRVPRWRD